jgi:hypothetical protein
MEVTQFTYFQQVGGYDCKPVAGELTYGLERLAMYIQGVDSVYDLAFNDEGVTYGDVFLQNEREFSAYNFEVADTESLFRRFKDAAEENRRCIEAGLPLPAYDQAIKASHIFNTLQARGVISVASASLYRPRPRSREGRLPSLDGEERVGGVRGAGMCNSPSPLVMPAKAGIHAASGRGTSAAWTPASAGVTGWRICGG